MLNCNICAHYNNNYVFPLHYTDNKYFSDKIEYLNMWRTSFVLNATFILFIFNGKLSMEIFLCIHVFSIETFLFLRGVNIEKRGII